MDTSYEISKSAEKDWRSIVEYTFINFGKRQVEKYTKSLLKCLDDLTEDVGHKKEIDVSGHQVILKHCQKHYIFGLQRNDKPLLIIAILHEQMDLMQRLKNRLNKSII